MRRLATTAVAAALPFSLLAFAPTAAENDVPLPDPVDVTMYFHGDDQRFVDDDAADPLAGIYRSMDRTAPTASDPDSRSLVTYGAGPNTGCSGNYLFPVWTGFVGQGTVVGDATLTIDVVGSGGAVVVEVYTGVSGQACNESYVQPVATADAVLPVGQGTLEVSLPLDGFDPTFDMMVQIRPADGPLGGTTDATAQARFLYDSTEFSGNISFTCQPDEVTFDDEGEPSHTPDCLPF